MGRDREDKPDYKVKLSRGVLLLQSGAVAGILPQLLLAGARRQPGAGCPLGLCLPDRQLAEATTSTYKNESTITFQDVQDCLMLVSSSFSTQTSYENQTKKAITNKFIRRP